MVIVHSFLYVYKRVSLVGKSSPTWLMSEVVDVDLSRSAKKFALCFLNGLHSPKHFGFFMFLIWLVVSICFNNVLFSIIYLIYGIILPIDFHIFQDG